MIYDVVSSTGGALVSDCSSEILGTKTFDLLNRDAVGSLGDFFYDRSVSTGQQEVSLYLNGQSLFQEVPFTSAITNETFYNIKTGDFFTKGDESDDFDKAKLYFHQTTPENGDSKLTYNIVTGGLFAATGDFGQSLKTNMNAGIGSVTFNDCDYFLNGQKVYSGMGVGVSMGTTDFDFIPLFATAANVAGVVKPENKDQFKYTAHKKTKRTFSQTGRYSDFIFTDGYIEKRNNYYVNGILQSQSNYLELYTGVNIIKTGFDATISGGLTESFEEPLSGSSLLL